jgi:hypothetical protein
MSDQTVASLSRPLSSSNGLMRTLVLSRRAL